MKDVELKDKMDIIANQARVAVLLAQDLDLKNLKASFRHAIDFGLFVDPTAWINGHRNAELSLALVEAFEQFVRDVSRLMTEVAKDV
jgi:hypothetical protein